jgi:hypothetical protein
MNDKSKKRESQISLKISGRASRKVAIKKLIFIGILAVICSCVPKSVLVDNYTFLLTEISTDETYGFSEKNPIKVGGVNRNEGPLNQWRFLNALAGPNGEEVSYYRAGSCCPVKSSNSPFGMAMLDSYSVTWEGSKDTVAIDINMYD